MRNDILEFFSIQRNIFGVCPHSRQLFRLSDCKIYLKTRPKRDWMDEIDRESDRLDIVQERLLEREEAMRERARVKGRKQARAAIRQIDVIFTPRNLNPDDAKVLFHPVDYIVFCGMKLSGSISRVVFLDRMAGSSGHRRIQRSIERAIEKGRYDWVTMRIDADGTITEDD
jgi:predicted Holliday junction resolvase-like endonuclease